MGMSTHIVGMKPADEKYRQMKAIWDACNSVGIRIPDEVGQFFNWDDPEPEGVRVEAKELGGAVEEILTGSGSGFRVDLTKLPRDITVLRFWNSW